MSPQSSANQGDIATISSLHALHKIESDSSNGDEEDIANSLDHKANSFCDGATTSASPAVRKRLHANNTPSAASSKDQPFLSSYGSAFLSGIFADIAQVSDDSQPPTPTSFPQEGGYTTHDDDANDVVSEPLYKRARTFTSFVVPTKGSTYEHPVVSPRPYAPIFTLHRINDHVRELQDMAFPSFPQMPVTVSAVSSCSSASLDMLTAEEFGDGNDEEGLSYGWFVSTDEDTPDASVGSASSFFMSDTKSSLAFKALAAPMQVGNQDVEVQQALAADTVDDVLGDLF